MQETKTYIGYWWLPGHEQGKIPGTLTLLDNGDYILQVLEVFENYDFNKQREFELIIGVAREEGSNSDFSFKLIHSLVISNAINKLTYYKFVISWVLKSFGTELSSNLYFNTLKIIPQNFNNWLNINGYKIEFPNPTKINDFQVNYQEQDNILLFKNEKLKIEIRIGISYNFPVNASFKSQQDAHLRIVFNQPRSLRELIDFSHMLRNFYTLAIGKPIKLEEFIVANHINSKEDANFSFYSKDKFRSNFNDSINDIHQRQMLFGFDLIKDDTQKIFDNWFVNHDLLKFTINNYFGSIYNNFLYAEDKFLNFVFGLEVYHKNRYNTFELRGKDYLKIRNDILDKINNMNHKNWLESRLNKYKENRLSDRIKHILELLKECISGLINEDETFIKQVVETRHFYVHEIVKDIDMVIKAEDELYKINNKLKVIIQAIILKEMGFDDITINKQIKKPIYNSMSFDVR